MTAHAGIADPLDSVKRRLALAGSDARTSFTCMGREFAVHPGVFPPTHFQSTGIFTRHLPYPRDGAFLEIGCGAGVTAVTAALAGCAHVVASDISQAAVRNTLANAILHGVEAIVSSRYGDLFDVLHDGERFDVIFWNSNFIFVPEQTALEQDILHAFCDPGYAAHRRFLHEAHHHLKPDGKLLLGFSDQGDDAVLAALLDECSYGFSVLDSHQGDGPAAPSYAILQLTPLPPSSPRHPQSGQRAGQENA